MLGIELLLTDKEKLILEFIRKKESVNPDLLGELIVFSSESPAYTRLIKLGLISYDGANLFPVDYYSRKKFIVSEESPVFVKELAGAVSGDYDSVAVLTEVVAQTDEITEIYKYWQESVNSKKAIKNEDRNAIKRMLKEYSATEVKQGIKGLTKDPWFMGDNPEGIKYNTLRHVAKNINRFIELVKNGN